MRFATVRLVLVLLAACSHPAHPSYARFIETTDHPNDVRKLIAARAEAAGISREVTLDVDRYTVTPVDHVEVRATREDDHTLIEVTGESATSIDLLAHGGTTYHRGWRGLADRIDPYQIDVFVEGGFAQAPHSNVPWRIDHGWHLGRRVWSRGGDTRTVTTRSSLSVFAGIGIAYDTAPAARPELGLTFDLQDVALRLRPWVSSQSTRKAVSLSFAVPIGKDHVAYEASLAVHAAPYGGLFVRGGYERGELGNGITWMAGARLDTKVIGKLLDSAVTLAGGVLLIGGCIYLLSKLEPGCNKNNPCE